MDLISLLAETRHQMVTVWAAPPWCNLYFIIFIYEVFFFFVAPWIFLSILNPLLREKKIPQDETHLWALVTEFISLILSILMQQRDFF